MKIVVLIKKIQDIPDLLCDMFQQLIGKSIMDHPVPISIVGLDLSNHVYLNAWSCWIGEDCVLQVNVAYNENSMCLL